jgi:hypothetical protein
VSNTTSLWLWSRRSPVRVRSLTLSPSSQLGPSGSDVVSSLALSTPGSAISEPTLAELPLSRRKEAPAHCAPALCCSSSRAKASSGRTETTPFLKIQAPGQIEALDVGGGGKRQAVPRTAARRPPKGSGRGVEYPPRRSSWG